MKPELLNLPPQLREIAKDHFRLLQPENLARKRDTVELRLSGYIDVMHLISDIVKVSIMALGESRDNPSAEFPDPASNISGVLSIVLDLLPYEEAELLDMMRYSALGNDAEDDRDWEFILSSVSLVPPRELLN